MVLATSQVEVFNNQIIDNRSLGCGIVSWFMTEKKIKDEEYDPYPTAIYIHDNTFRKKKRAPTFKSRIGLLLFQKFKRKVPDILYDGIVNPETLAEDGSVKEEYRICIRGNNGAKFANLDAENDFENISRSTAPFDCSRGGGCARGPAVGDDGIHPQGFRWFVRRPGRWR